MNKKGQKLELIAPAGSFEKMKYAFEFGADAAYAGLPDFSLRARINKFDEAQILKAIDYARSRNKKIYITTNIFAHNRHLDILKDHLKTFKKKLPDAFIASDIGVIQAIKEILPDATIHLSTQANTTNWRAAKFWHEQGVKRIVLARELTLEEIREIHQKVPRLELEYFVHGAMCMAYSGRCLLSSWKIGRSSNLGDCAQNCRWQYSLVEEKRPNEYIPVEQDNFGTYLMNSKDLCLIEYLDELKKAGVSSFKIEGRAKSAYYLAQVVKAYRTALGIDLEDAGKKEKIKKLKLQLKKLANRNFTTGFLFGKCREEGQETKLSRAAEDHTFVGEVFGQENVKIKIGESHKSRNLNLTKIKVHNALESGDKIEFIQPNQENISCKIKNIFDDETLEKLTSAHGGQDRMVYIEITKTPEVFSIIRKKIKKPADI